MIKIAYIGAGSLQFGPMIVQDILMSNILSKNGLKIFLMDIEKSHLDHVLAHGEYVNKELARNAEIVATTDRDEAINKIFGEETTHFSFAWLRAMVQGKASPVHIDHPYMNRGTDKLVTCWTPLTGIEENEGTLYVMQNSHLWSDIKNKFLGLDIDATPSSPGHIQEHPIDLINGDKMAENVIEFSDQSFDSGVLESDVPVLVDFWAVWCGPCKAIAPIVEEIANDYDGKVKVGKIDVDNNNQVAMKYGIRSIPTLLLFKGGEVVDQVIGNVGKESIESMLNKAL